MKKVYLIAAALLTSSSLQQTAWGMMQPGSPQEEPRANPPSRTPLPLTAAERQNMTDCHRIANEMTTDPRAVHRYDGVEPNTINVLPQRVEQLKTIFPKLFPNYTLNWTDPQRNPLGDFLSAVHDPELRNIITSRWNVQLSNPALLNVQRDLLTMELALLRGTGFPIDSFAPSFIPPNGAMSAFYNVPFVALVTNMWSTLLQQDQAATSGAPAPRTPQMAGQETRSQANPKQQQDAEKAEQQRIKQQHQQELAQFNQFLTESNSAQVFRDELIPLTYRNNPEFHAEWDRFFQDYEANFRLQPASRNIRTASQEFQKAFWDYAIRVISQQTNLTWRNTYTFKSWYRLLNYVKHLGTTNPEGIHALDPLVQSVLPQILGCAINQANMDQPGDRQTATRVSDTFMTWIHQSDLDSAVRATATENLREKFLRPKGQDGINFQASDPDRTHWRASTFEDKKKTYTSYNAYQRIDDSEEEAFYPSLGLRLEWQAGFLAQAEALIRFVDSLPTEGLKNNLKRNLVFAFSEAIEADGLCLVGNWTRWFEAILKLGYAYIQLGDAVTGTEEADLTWLARMPHHETPQPAHPETPRTQAQAGTLTANDTFEEFKRVLELYYPDSQLPFDSQKQRIMGYLNVLGDRTAEDLLNHQYPMNCLGLSPLHLDNDEDAWSENGSDMGSDNDEDEDSDEGTDTGATPPSSTREEIFQGIGTSFQGEGAYPNLTDIHAILASNPGIKSYLDTYLPIFPNTTPEQLLSDQSFKDLCNKCLRSSANSRASSLRKPESFASRPETRAPARSSPTQILDVSTLRAPLIEALRRTPSTGFRPSEEVTARKATALISIAQRLFPNFQGSTNRLVQMLAEADDDTLQRFTEHMPRLFALLSSDDDKVNFVAELSKAEISRLGDLIEKAREYFSSTPDDKGKIAIVTGFAKIGMNRLDALFRLVQNPQARGNLVEQLSRPENAQNIQDVIDIAIQILPWMDHNTNFDILFQSIRRTLSNNDRSITVQAWSNTPASNPIINKFITICRYITGTSQATIPNAFQILNLLSQISQNRMPSDTELQSSERRTSESIVTFLRARLTPEQQNRYTGCDVHDAARNHSYTSSAKSFFETKPALISQNEAVTKVREAINRITWGTYNGHVVTREQATAVLNKLMREGEGLAFRPGHDTGIDVELPKYLPRIVNYLENKTLMYITAPNGQFEEGVKTFDNALRNVYSDLNHTRNVDDARSRAEELSRTNGGSYGVKTASMFDLYIESVISDSATAYDNHISCTNGIRERFMGTGLLRVMVFIPELEQGLTGSSALENVGLQGKFDNECGKINGTPGKALEFIREHGGPIAQQLQPSNDPTQNRKIFIQAFLRANGKNSDYLIRNADVKAHMETFADAIDDEAFLPTAP